MIQNYFSGKYHFTPDCFMNTNRKVKGEIICPVENSRSVADFGAEPRCLES